MERIPADENGDGWATFTRNYMAKIRDSEQGKYEKMEVASQKHKKKLEELIGEQNDVGKKHKEKWGALMLKSCGAGIVLVSLLSSSLCCCPCVFLLLQSSSTCCVLFSCYASAL